LTLPNLIPSEGPIEFKSSFDAKSNVLHITFRDPATWCQTHSLALKCNSSQVAVRWLYRSLGARFEVGGLKALWSGESTTGTADGSLVVPMSLALASETILTEDVYTIWFTGAYPPFEARQYSLELLKAKLSVSQPSNSLLSAIEKTLDKVSFPASSTTEWAIVEAEFEILRNFPFEPSEPIARLAQLFITAALDEEFAIVKQLDELEHAVLEVLNQRAER